MSADIRERQLTASQRLAIESTDRWVAVVASAGSGKTTVLIDRCLAILGGNPSNIDRLLAITFTEKAAAELLARLRRSLPSKSHHLLATAWVGTFHAFCARILRTNAPLVGLDPSFSILDENAFRLLAEQIIRENFISLLDKKDEHALCLIEELEFKNTVSLLGELVDFRWHSRRSLQNPPKTGGADLRLHRAVTHCYGAAEKAVLAAMARQGAIDFQELEIKALELLNDHPAVRAAYQRKFKHILVDEYQDTSDIQSELVFLLANPKINRLAIVGDPRQSIYRFRGANVHCFEQALDRVSKAGGEIIDLKENFRSEPAIITFTNDTFENLWDKFGPKLAPMKAERKDVHRGPAVTALVFEPSENKETSPILRSKEAEGLASYVAELASEGKFRFSDICCLFQAMTNIADYEAAFKKAAIPYRIFGGRGLLERQEISDLMHALTYAADPGNDIALIGLLRSPLIGLSDDDIAMMAGPDGKELRRSVSSDERLSLLKFLHESAAHMRPSELLRATIDKTGYEHICLALDPSGGMQANMERLVALSESLEIEGPTPLSSFIEFISDLRDRSARLGDPPALGFGGDAISCMTVHTAKGLEFPVVVIPDLMRQTPKKRGPWRFSRRDGVGFKIKDQQKPFGDRIETELFTKLEQTDDMEERQETKRLLYVAMTRARDLLVLPIHRNDKIRGLWHEWLRPIVDSRLLGQRDVADGVVCGITARKRTLSLSGRGITPMDAPASEIPPHPLAPAPTIQNRNLAQPNDLVNDAVPTIPSAREPNRHSASKIFSVSELETYERCPHEYYLKYVLGLPANDVFKDESKKLPANVRGSIVHGVIQRYDPSKDKTVGDLISSECISASVFPDKHIVGEIEKLLSRFAKNPIAKTIDKGKRELRFDWKLENWVITGSIDWLKPEGDGFDIVDFKTDAIGADEVEKRATEYDLQLVTYALAAADALGEKIKETVLYFLEPDVIYTKAMDEKRAAKSLSRIKQIIECIGKGEFGLYEKKPPCYKCPYSRNKMCNERSDN